MKQFLFLTLAFALYSCSYSHTSGGRNEAPAGFSDGNGDNKNIRYADVDAIVFMNSCTACHQKKGLDLSFADYANSKEFANEIAVRVFDDQDMPPRGGLTELQIQVLRTWIDSGSPE